MNKQWNICKVFKFVLVVKNLQFIIYFIKVSWKCRCIEIEVLVQISIHPFEARIVHKVQVYKSKVVVIQWWISHLGQTIKQSNNQMIKWSNNFIGGAKCCCWKKESTFFCSLKKKFFRFAERDQPLWQIRGLPMFDYSDFYHKFILISF